MSKTSIYADHAATTRLSPAALDAMLPYLKNEYGNPSTAYSLAREPRKAIRIAREAIANAINAKPEEIIFTSGGSEADNMAIKGVALKHIGEKKQFITSTIEHHAVLHAFDALERFGLDVCYLPVDDVGVVDGLSLRSAVSAPTALVSIMFANNEIGTIEPIQQLAEIAHRNGALFHTDAVQAIGHVPVDVQEQSIDLLSASAHKFNGPKGVGFLYIRDGVILEPLIHGGGQEHGLRAGTENVAGIVGMAAALSEHVRNMSRNMEHLNSLQSLLVKELRSTGSDFCINGSKTRIPGNLSISFEGVSGELLLHRLDLMGISVATGSACNSEKTEISHVIKAIGVPMEYALGTIRISLGAENTKEDVLRIAESINIILRSLREA